MVAPAADLRRARDTRSDPRSLARGWAIPCATDIAFSAMVARIIFPGGHPAIPFLLLLAIADDALGLIILAVFYPSGSLSFVALGLADERRAAARAGGCGAGASRASGRTCSARARCRGRRCTWAGFIRRWRWCPIVPFMPHSAQDLGLFDPREEAQADTLNRFEHWWARPVQFVLLLFGFANAGVPFEQIGTGTYYVLAALLLGKPLGILVFSYAARWRARACRRAPAGGPGRRRDRGRHRLYRIALLCDRGVPGRDPCLPRRRWARFSASAPRPWRCSRHALLRRRQR